MSQQRWNDDDQLLAALDEALRSGCRVPAEFIATGKAAYKWRGIAAEIAVLTYDSVFEGAGEEVAGVRSDPASVRYLTLTAGDLSVELEVTADAILGQLVPPGPGRAEVHSADGSVVTAGIDEGGGFTLRPVPGGSFRLYCDAANGMSVMTNWLTLHEPRG